MSKTKLQVDLESRLYVDDLFEWIEVQAEQLATHSRINEGFVEISPNMLSNCGVISIERRSNINGLAYINYESEGYRIYCAAFLDRYDYRFQVAHELAHTFFFDKQNPGEPLSPYQLRIGSDANLESIVNRFAAAILIPRNRLKHQLERIGIEYGSSFLPLSKIGKLSNIFGVPPRAFVRRYFHNLQNQPIAFFKCLPNSNQLKLFKNQKLPSSWKIEWSAVTGFDTSTRESVERIKIPEEMVPSPDENKNNKQKIDGRWLNLAMINNSNKRRTPLKFVKKKKSILGWTANLDGGVIVAFKNN